MDDESRDDDKDGLTSGWGGESRQGRWLMRLTKWIWKSIPKTKLCIS